MIAWSRLAVARSGPFISAIFASTALSPSALSAPRRAAAFSSCARSFIATRSSSVNPLDVLPIAVVLLADFCVPFFAGFLSAIAKHLLQTAQCSQEDAGVGALGHHLGDGAALVVGDAGVGGRRLQDDGRAGLVCGADRDPAHPAISDVVTDIEAEGVAIEGQG